MKFFNVATFVSSIVSPPTRRCGLKSALQRKQNKERWSPPTRRCGLKSVQMFVKKSPTWSPPTRRCGLKSPWGGKRERLVAVTSYAEVWIEIYILSSGQGACESPPTRRCGLKSGHILDVIPLPGHLLRGGVD